jgi:hypothetical protein
MLNLGELGLLVWTKARGQLGPAGSDRVPGVDGIGYGGDEDEERRYTEPQS